MEKEKRTRRNFIKKSVIGIGAAAIVVNANAYAQTEEFKRQKKLPREVWIATVSQHEILMDNPKDMISRILKIMDEIVPLNPDIICLPEIFPFTNIRQSQPLAESAEKPIGPVIKPFAEFAKKNNCYVICSTYTEDAGKYYNAAVLLDRQGKLVGEFRKIHLPEGEPQMGISPGSLDPPVFDTDFGKIGMQICFDGEWIDGWSKLQKAGAEIVFWPSAYDGGKKLNAFALLFNYCVVSSTQKDSARIIDLTGSDIASTGRWNPNWICASVNLEKEVITTYPNYLHFNDIKAKYGRDVKITTLHNEEMSVIESLSPDLKVADILKEFKIKTKKEYLQSTEEALRMKRTN